MLRPSKQPTSNAHLNPLPQTLVPAGAVLREVSSRRLKGAWGGDGLGRRRLRGGDGLGRRQIREEEESEPGYRDNLDDG